MAHSARSESELLTTDCHATRAVLHEFVDGELGPPFPHAAPHAQPDAVRVAAHLDVCVPCRTLVHHARVQRERLRAYAGRADERAGEQPSAAFRERLSRLLSG